MIVNLPFLKQIALAMNDRIREAEEAYFSLESEITSISTANWDDAKRKEYTQVVSEIKESISKSLAELKEYLVYLQSKIAILENK